MRRLPCSTPWLTLFVCLVGLRLFAQEMVTDEIKKMNSSRPMLSVPTYESAPHTAVIVVHMFGGEKPVSLDRSARVELTNVGSHYGQGLIVSGHDAAVFANTPLGNYVISASAVGYLTTRQEISVTRFDRQEVDLVLRRDPAAIALNEASGLMSKQAKKEANRAVSLLKSNRLADAGKHLDAAYKLAPANADLNFLLGYLHFEQKDYAGAGTYLRTAVGLNPRSTQALILLGRTNLEQQDFPTALSAFVQATLVDPDEWLPHHLLAYTYLHEREYNKASDEAKIAVAKSERYGKSASSAAELNLGQALVALGQKKEGVQALRKFLEQSPAGVTADQVRSLISIAESEHTAAAGSKVTATAADPLIVVPKVALAMQTWRPSDIDDVKPIVEPGVSCPCSQVLAAAGQRVQDLVQDVTRFSAEEGLFHQSLDSVGLVTSTETRKYDYIAAIRPQKKPVQVEEYHQDSVPQHGYPDGIGTTGFMMLALILHPELQGDFDFACEGRGEWRGQPTWLVHFRQRQDRPNHMQIVEIGGQSYRVDLKGRAWISTDTLQVVRIEADITNPVHEVELLSEHQTVQYGPVPFAKKNMTLWLPKDAEIYVDFRKRRFHRQFSFDHYAIFDVDVSETRKLPPSIPTSPSTAKEQK